jgi:hypothetical protein
MKKVKYNRRNEKRKTLFHFSFLICHLFGKLIVLKKELIYQLIR